MFVNTLNKMGYMTTEPDAYSKEFIEYASTINLPVLEIGAAYGVTTQYLVEKNDNVFMNDLCHEHLKIFKDKLSDRSKEKVTLCPGAFPEECNFPEDSFGGILACRVLHLLPPEKLQGAIEYAYALLKPGGKFFFVADTPYLSILKGFHPIYEDRVKQNTPWPGYIEDTAKYVGARAKEIPTKVNFLDINTLGKAFEASQFKTEKIDYIAQTAFPEDAQFDGRESVGIIAVK
ncbi:MAG: class I SAM-dependent methyltransferase [Alphaproteobacteria bacterium]|jgi:SAM-dependent methyltransferase|nr:class I SAM-dependent methyltransferase [Alphaproteobacteria bacterium]MBT5390439.1 class I SAM-dependent methyltransferase [Alphaproteobacteria bacterium]MBT5540236.1 class I SAM-dependent methyltransferase [Alphaproteobacteria bacterium]MBT5654144.1 class I SAM-dependent methyltransferase [Alphaproteobacteria bacterium]